MDADELAQYGLCGKCFRESVLGIVEPRVHTTGVQHILTREEIKRLKLT